MTKVKRASSARRLLLMRLLKWTLGTIGFFLCGVLGCGWTVSDYFTSGALLTSIEPALLPTAEYLYQHPQPTLTYLSVRSESVTNICYDLMPSQDYSDLYTDVFLNGARIPKMDHISHNLSMALSRIDTPHLYCINSGRLPLEPGLHLVEIQLKGYPWDNTYPRYQWAVKVDEE